MTCQNQKKIYFTPMDRRVGGCDLDSTGGITPRGQLNMCWPCINIRGLIHVQKLPNMPLSHSSALNTYKKTCPQENDMYYTLFNIQYSTVNPAIPSGCLDANPAAWLSTYRAHVCT